MYIVTKLIPIFNQVVKLPNLGRCVQIEYEIPELFTYPLIDANIEFNDIINHVDQSHSCFRAIVDDAHESIEVLRNSKPFFRYFSYDHGSFSGSGLSGEGYQLHSDLSLFENILDNQADHVNSYVFNPCIDTLRPLVEKSPFVQQIQEGYQSFVVDHLLDYLSGSNLMDIFTFVFQISKDNISYFSFYTDFLNKISDSFLSADLLFSQNMIKTIGLFSLGFGDHTITILGFLGFLSDSFYSNPGILRLPPAVFLQTYPSLFHFYKCLLGIRVQDNTFVYHVAEFSKIFLESLKKNNDKLLNSLSLYREFGLLKSQPSYVKYLKWLKDPSSFNLSVEIGVNNKTASLTIGKSSWFNWRIIHMTTIGTLFIGLSSILLIAVRSA